MNLYATSESQSAPALPVQRIIPNQAHDARHMFQLLVQNYAPSRQYGETVLDWTKLTRNLDFNTPVLASATRALSLALIARSTGNKETTHLSLKSYGDALLQLKEASSSHGPVSNPSELLEASLFMGLYEIFEVPAHKRSGWLVHRQGMVPLLEICPLQPDLNEADLEMLKTVRFNLVLSSLVCRKNIIPADLVLVGPAWETLLQRIVGVLAKIPSLLESSDQVTSIIKGLDETNATAFLFEQIASARYVAMELYSWNLAYAIDIVQDDGNECFNANTPFLRAQSMLLYWTGQLYISTILDALTSHLDSQRSSHLNDVDIDAYVAARRIVSTASYFLSPGIGFVGRNAITLPLIVALRYFVRTQGSSDNVAGQQSAPESIRKIQKLFVRMDLRGLPV